MFNHIVPRIGATLRSAPATARPCSRRNWGRFYFNPGVNLADAVNANTARPVRRLQLERPQRRPHLPGRRRDDARPVAVRRRRRAPSSTRTSRTRTPTRPRCSSSARCIADLGVRVGYVWKKDSDGWQQHQRPAGRSAPSTCRSRSSIRVRTASSAHGDNGPDMHGVQPGRHHRAAEQPASRRTSPGYEGTYKTLEFSANKRYSNRWSLNASYSYIVDARVRQQLLQQPLRHGGAGGSFSFFGSFPPNPNERTEQRVHQLEREVLRHGGRRLGPARDAGAEDAERRAVRPLHRRRACNYNTAQLDPGRADRHASAGQRRPCSTSASRSSCGSRSKARVGLFFDLFNALNSNTAVNINWRSGASFEKATTVLGPRIAKFGVKFDW